MIDICTALTAAIETDVVLALEGRSDVRVVRRCADMGELAAVAAAGRAQVVLLSPGIQGVDRSALADVRASGIGILGVHEPLDEQQQALLHQWGVTRQVCSTAAPEEIADAVAATALAIPLAVVPDPSTPEAGDTAGSVVAEPLPADRATTVVVWGTHGAPGRTTVAVNFAAECALLGKQVLLVDLDMHAPSVAPMMGLLNEAPGVAAACRLAESGRLDVISLAGAAPVVMPGVRVLTGLPIASRWPEIRPPAVESVLATARALVDVVIVDISASLEDDEELSYDTRAPRRNGAALQALECADHILAVGAGDPIGLQRLVRDLPMLAEVSDAPAQVVINKVRASAAGRSPRSAISEALERFTTAQQVQLIADDRDACDKAALRGLSLSEHAPDSAARRDIAELVALVLGADEATPVRRGRRVRIPRLRRSAARA